MVTTLVEDRLGYGAGVGAMIRLAESEPLIAAHSSTFGTPQERPEQAVEREESVNGSVSDLVR